MELGVIPADTPDIAGGLDLGGDLPVLDAERNLVGNDLPAQMMVQRNAVRVEQGEGFAFLVHLGQALDHQVHGSTYFSEPIAFEMDDGDIKESIRPYAMGRIIDVEDFLADYPCDPDGGTLCIELEIEDSLLPWNDRTFNVRFADGHCTMTREPAEYHLKMGIGTFTTLLLGYKTAERLYELERIEGREEAVERLDDVLFHKIPYISDYI